MPFYSRHSSDGRDRFLEGIHDEEFLLILFDLIKTNYII